MRRTGRALCIVGPLQVFHFSVLCSLVWCLSGTTLGLIPSDARFQVVPSSSFDAGKEEVDINFLWSSEGGVM